MPQHWKVSILSYTAQVHSKFVLHASSPHQAIAIRMYRIRVSIQGSAISPPLTRPCAGIAKRQQGRPSSPFLARSLKTSVKIMSTASSGSSARMYQWQDDVEDLEAYRPGGYHPVLLDDTYCENRYRVVHKLGFGSYSTVWLARDCLADKYVSLKILTAKSSEHSREAQMLSHIATESKMHLGHRFVPSLCEEFIISGPNGEHKCLVSEILGPTVLQIKESFQCDLLPLDIAKRVTVQLALGLASVHLCGITHGGR